MSDKGRMLIGGFIILLIVGSLSMGYKWWFAPKIEVARKTAEKEKHDDLIKNTSSKSHYDHLIKIAADSFSGYAGLRNENFINHCSSQKIKIIVEDDGADYTKRINNLANGEIQFAVFTIDAFYKACSEYGDLPGSIIWCIDESLGADAVVAHENSFPDLDALNDPNTKFVITPDSPSETLARVIVNQFGLNKLSDDPFVKVNGAEEVYFAYRSSKPNDKNVFVLWEPYISKMTDNPDYRALISTNKLRGFIVDVMVVNRDFLHKNREVVNDIAESYFTAMYENRNNLDKMISKDALSLGESLSEKQIKAISEGIQYKNTQENYAHFGLVEDQGMQHIENIIGNIVEVLTEAKVVSSDPTNGALNKLYYDGILNDMISNNFHPGAEKIRSNNTLAVLSDKEWGSLRPVGTLEIPTLKFRRGSSKLSGSSTKILTELSKKLKNFPQYYLIVKGNASTKGNLEKNIELSEARSNTALEWLVTNGGVSKSRIRAVSAEPSGSTTVSFVLGEIPY